MSVTLKSNKAKVRDHDSVLIVLADYDLDGVEIDVKKENSSWTLEMAYHDSDFNSLTAPRAVRLEEMPDPDEYSNDDDLYMAQQDTFDEKGGEGFLALLVDLAHYLESPLMILVADASLCGGFGYAAQVLRIEPGGIEVESLEV
jgi:hypothetical protein